MFKKKMPQNFSAIVAGIALSGMASAAYAQDVPLVSSVDLPGVPISITERPRAVAAKPANPAATAEAQASASMRVSERDAEIAEMEARVAELQSSRTNPAAENTAEIAQELERQILDNKDTQRPEPVILKPGVNKVLSISRGHPNRLIAPFAEPEVRTTTTDAEITTSGEIIYVATGSKQPVTLFVSPKGNERMAASITLLPQAIPPQEIRFRLDAGDEVIKYANPSAEKWETRNAYVDTITGAFRALALQDLPQGYTMRKPAPSDYVTCNAGKGVSFELGQVVEGHNMEIQIAVVTNHGSQPVEVIGHQCAGYRVLAAAEWPHSILEPGQQTEMFIALQRLEDAEPEIRRPSLIQE